MEKRIEKVAKIAKYAGPGGRYDQYIKLTLGKDLNKDKEKNIFLPVKTDIEMITKLKEVFDVETLREISGKTIEISAPGKGKSKTKWSIGPENGDKHLLFAIKKPARIVDSKDLETALETDEGPAKHDDR